MTNPDVHHRNIQIGQSVYSAFAKRDVPAILALLSPDVEWGEPANPFHPTVGMRRGHAGFLDWQNIGRQSEDMLTSELRKFLADHDSVAVIGYTKCHAKPTNRTYETDFVHLVTLEDGKVLRFQEFFDTFAAAEAFRKG